MMIIAFITKRKRPKVKIVAGNVKSTNKGFKKALRSPKTKATYKAAS